MAFWEAVEGAGLEVDARKRPGITGCGGGIGCAVDEKEVGLKVVVGGIGCVADEEEGS